MRNASIRLVIVLLADLLTACDVPVLGKSLPVVVKEKRGSAAPPNHITQEDLRRNAIRVDVPAGEWRMLRLEATDLLPGGGSVTVAIAYQHLGDAEPYIGFGSQYIDRELNDPFGIAGFLLAGVPAEKLGASGFISSWATTEPDRLNPEFVYIVGSRNGPATFFLGIPELPAGRSLTDYSASELLFGGVEVRDFGRESAEQLAQRPLMQASLESGQGGFGAWYLRNYDENGEVITQRGGRYELESSVGTSTPGDIEISRRTRVAATEDFRDVGVFSYNFYAKSQFGVDQYTWSVNAADYSNGESIVYAPGLNIYAYSASCTVTSPCLPGTRVNFDNLHAYGSFPAMPGNLQLKIDHSSTGRYGGSAEGLGAPVSAQFFPGQYLFAWGNVQADFKALYGWDVGVVEYHP